MRPMREPLRSLIFVAAERAVKDVFVDGLLVRSAYVPAAPPEEPWTIALA